MEKIGMEEKGKESLVKGRLAHLLSQRQLKNLSKFQHEVIAINYGFDMWYEDCEEFWKQDPDLRRRERFAIKLDGTTIIKTSRVHAVLKGTCLGYPVVLCYEIRHDGRLHFEGLHIKYECPTREYYYEKRCWYCLKKMPISIERY